MNSHSPEKKSDPKELGKNISPILVVNNSKLKPFIELFENYPENIMLHNLGTLFGFFKINDKSEDSAYIVNFLSSVIKKEYYINHKRPVDESFDGALHKVNLALAEVAKNGNIRWIGQLDAAICVLEKNILHFTVCGAAKILLLRNQTLSDISQNLNPEELEPNPIKTFSNVSSGYLEKGDKIIVTSSDLFNIFSLNELKKGILRFDQEKFVQFLRTAMVNELDSASTIIIDIAENQPQKEPKKTRAKTNHSEINPFDSKTFEKPGLSLKDAIKQSKKENDIEYTDEKTGHIYVQGEAGEPKVSTFWNELGTSFLEKFSDFSYWLKIRLKRSRLGLKQFAFWLKEKMVLAKIKILRKIKEWRKERSEKEPELKEDQPVEKIILTEELVENDQKSEETAEKTIAVELNEPSKAPNGILVWLMEIWRKMRNSKLPEIIFSKLKFGLRVILPAFSRIKKSFLRLNYQQRLYAILTVIVILTAPLLVSKFSSPEEIPPQIEPEPQISERDILLQDKNIREVSISSTLASSDIQKVISLNDQLLAVSATEIASLDSNGAFVAKFHFPSDFSTFSSITSMEDLNLIFLLSPNGRLLSFSPISKKFQENNLALPENKKIEILGTYLTYLYAVDSESNQIYRYPRAEGGFGAKVDWLKETLDLQNLSDMAIEENLYLASATEITKFFQGKKQVFNLDSTNVPLSINKLFTGRNIANLYVLDSKNGRVVKYTKDGLLLNQYYSEKLIGASDFAVDEKNNKIHFVNSEGLSSFGI